MRENKFILFFATILIAATAMVSCSEEDDTVEEYPDWRNRNETYYDNLSDSVRRLIAANPDCGWKRIKNWSYPVVDDGGADSTNSDYIIVEVIESADDTETGSPLYSDSISVHYTGNLLPSTTYTGGLMFTSTYVLPFEPDIATPVRMAVSGTVDGFTTAVMNMRRGDHWKVYIPHELGYGSADNTSSGIPAYSTLIFEIRLVDFWRLSYDD